MTQTCRMFALLAAVAVVLALGVSASVAQSHSLGAAPVLSQVDGSGIRAQILFLDTGAPENGLIASGRAEGLDPNRIYTTLIYNAGSVSTGPAACLPTNAILDKSQMFVGNWKVSADGTGTLFAVKMGESFASLDDVGTTSVRVLEGSDLVLRACGDVVPALARSAVPRPGPFTPRPSPSPFSPIALSAK